VGVFDGIKNLFTRSRSRTSFVNLPISLQNAIIGGMTSQLLETPEIKTAINFVAEVFSTIPMYHRRTDSEGNTEYVKRDIDFVLNRYPNVLQTKTQMWITAITQLLVNNNVALYPSRDGERLASIVPLPFFSWQLEERDDGSWVVDFNNGEKRYPVEAVVLLSRFCTLKGGNGKQAITLHQSIMQAIQKRAEQTAINPKIIQAYLKIKQGNIKSDAKEARAKEIVDQLLNTTVGGLPVIDGDAELNTINITPVANDTKLLAEITEIVYNYFGISAKFIQRQFSEAEWQAFITTTIQPMANQVSEELSKKLFTVKELQFGNWIELDVTAKQVATLDAKTNFIKAAIPHGVASANEAREMLGFGRKQNGKGDDFYTTLNMVEETKAAEYQMAKKNGNVKGGNNG